MEFSLSAISEIKLLPLRLQLVTPFRPILLPDLITFFTYKHSFDSVDIFSPTHYTARLEIYNDQSDITELGPYSFKNLRNAVYGRCVIGITSVTSVLLELDQFL